MWVDDIRESRSYEAKNYLPALGNGVTFVGDVGHGLPESSL